MRIIACSRKASASSICGSYRQFDGRNDTWLWGGKYPHYMDALVPMASQPTEMAARNWMLRRMMLETIRNDPDTTAASTPAAAHDEIRHHRLRHRHRRRHACYQMLAPTAAKADKMVDDGWRCR